MWFGVVWYCGEIATVRPFDFAPRRPAHGHAGLPGFLGCGRHNYRLAVPGGRTPVIDMLFSDIVVEFDGAYWHHDGQRRDLAKNGAPCSSWILGNPYPRAPLNP
jgi:hypothetical protein